MIVNVVTSGFVVQSYDTEKREFFKQEFIASDEFLVENEDGEEVWEDVPYHPFDMVQPIGGKSPRLVYDVYYTNTDGDVIDKTQIDENDMELAEHLRKEFNLPEGTRISIEEAYEEE